MSPRQQGTVKTHSDIKISFWVLRSKSMSLLYKSNCLCLVLRPKHISFFVDSLTLRKKDNLTLIWQIHLSVCRILKKYMVRDQSRVRQQRHCYLFEMADCTAFPQLHALMCMTVRNHSKTKNLTESSQFL